MTTTMATAINLWNAPSLATTLVRCTSTIVRRTSEIPGNRQVRLIATATNEASATTAVVARMLAVILSAREILEWSVAAHVVDTVVMAARNPRIDKISHRMKVRR
jgi:hypothetical protein